MKKNDLLILSLLLFLSFYATLGYYPLFNLDEGAFSEATREMLASHNFLTTYLNGQLRFDKPILIYWLQAASATLFGLNEFAMRLPSALAATLWALAIFLFAKKVLNEQKAFWATLFMAGSLQISIIAKAAIADSLLNLFIALSMLSFYLYTESKKKRFLYITFAAIGFGTLTKGPVAILIPVVVSFLFLIKDLKFWAKAVFNPIGIALFILIAAPWYIAEYLDQGERFIEGFLLKHNISRFESAMEGHKGSFFYYIPVLLIGLLPFTSIFLKTITFLKEWFDTPLKRYLGIWFLFVFAFFSFSATKLPHYIVYGYTPLFILMAIYFEKIRSNFWMLLPFLLFCLLFFALPFLQPLIVENLRPNSYDFFIVSSLHFSFMYILFFGFSFIAGIFLIKAKKSTAIVTASFLTIIGLNFFIAKTYAEAAEKPIKEAAIFAKKRHLQVVMDGINTPSFSFYARNIVKRRPPKPGDVVFTKRSRLNKYADFDILFVKNGIALIKLKEPK